MGKARADFLVLLVCCLHTLRLIRIIDSSIQGVQDRNRSSKLVRVESSVSITTSRLERCKYSSRIHEVLSIGSAGSPYLRSHTDFFQCIDVHCSVFYRLIRLYAGRELRDGNTDSING